MSEDHLLKVVQRLSQLGYVQTIRGRNGGMRLARAADEGCPIVPACGLTHAVDEALQAFLTSLDRYTVADLIARRSEMRALAHIGSDEIVALQHAAS